MPPPAAPPPWPPPYDPYLQYYWGPPPPRIWTVFVAFVAAFVATQVVGIAILGAVLLMTHPGRLTSPDQAMQALLDVIFRPDILLALGVVTQLVILGVALAAVYLSPVKLVQRLRLGRSTLPIYGYPLVIAGAISIGWLYQFVIERLHVQPRGMLKLLEGVLTHLTSGQLVAAILVVGILPGIAEEWFFRGYMQTRLSQRLGRWAAILITALLFGLMHMDLLQSPFAALFGIYLGYAAEKCGSIRPTMICHMVNNSLQVALAAWVGAHAAHAPPPSEHADISMSYALYTAIAAAMLSGAVAYLRFAIQPPPQEPAPAPQPPGGMMPPYLPWMVPPPPPGAWPAPPLR